MSDLSVTASWQIHRFQEDAYVLEEDLVAAEFPLTLYVNDKEFATIVCTPADLEEMVTGFLASEGVIREARDIADLSIDDSVGRAFVNLNRRSPLDPALFVKRRIASCCGKSRQSFYFYADAQTAKPVDTGLRLTPAQCYALMRQLHEASDIHRHTGGVHYAALSGEDGETLLAGYADIGRHNALDKLYGHCLRTGLPTADKALVFSGRLASEVVLKAAKIGSAILLSKSAPTDLALQLADELGLTAVGFLRGRGMNVYTHPHRIVGGADGSTGPGPF